MDADEEILNMTEWKEKGCAVCRHQWESGERPPELAVNYALHSRLHRCPDCSVYWEQNERHANVINEVEAQKLYPELFLKELAK